METYLLTLLVTFEQEYAIQRLFTRHGWKYDKKENLADSHTDTTKPSAGAANASGPNGDNADLVDNRGSARIDIGEATVKVESGKSLNDKDDKLEYRIEEADHTVNDNYNDDTDDGGFGDTETLGADGDHDMDSVDVNQKQANCSQKHSDKIESSNINTSGTEDNITAARTPTTKRKRGNATPTKVIPTRKQAKVLPPAKASTSNAEKNDTFPDGITVKIEKDDEASFHLAELETIPGIEHYSKLVTFAAESDAPVAPPSDVDENGHSVALSAYFCSACGYTFPEEKLYLGHKRVGQCVFPCGFCGEVYSFRNYSKYEEHVKTHRSEMEFQLLDGSSISDEEVLDTNAPGNAPPCAKQLNAQSTVSQGTDYKQEQSVSGHQIHTKYKCCECGFESKNRSHLVKHRTTHVKDKQLSNKGSKTDGASAELKKSFQCGNCEFKTSYKCNLIRHSNTHSCSQKREKHVCDICGKQFISKYGCKLHINKVHADKFWLTCKICDKGFMQKTHFHGHIARHHNLKPHKCNKCGAAYTYLSTLKQHQQACSKKSKGFSCQECGIEFEHKKNLQEHTRGKHGPPSYTCECGKVFRWRSCVKKHKHKCTFNRLTNE